MAEFTADELSVLLEDRDGAHASLYMPTIVAGPETRQNPIRFKNLLRELEDKLTETGRDADAVGQILEPAAALVDDFEFWQHTGHGFALLLSDGFYRHYHLPYGVDEFTWVGQRFYLKPLLRQLGRDQDFNILALSQNAARLLRADPHQVSEIDLGDTPTSLTDAVGDELSEQALQFHTGDAGGQPIYHAQGGGDDDVKPEIRKFLSLLDQGVCDRIGQDGRPLLLAGVEYMTAMYRGLSNHPSILDRIVAGNAEHLSDDELRDKAWPVVEPHLNRDIDELFDRYRAAAADQRGSAQLEDILTAAIDGRVDTLAVARGERCWGRYDADARQTERHPQPSADSEDLLDRAAVETLTRSGRVVVCDPQRFPDQQNAVAVYRY